MCPNTCFSRTTYSLSRCNVKGELDCFNCKAGGGGGGGSQIIHFNVYKRKQLQSTFLRKNQLVYGEYLTIIKKLKLKPGPHIVVAIAEHASDVPLKRILKADFLSWQKVLATIFFQKKSVK